MTINELAKLAGVSISTVSKVMNNKDDSISQSTRERILKIAKEYHYTPMVSAQKKQRSLSLGVIFRSAKRMNLMLSGMIDAAQKKGYTLLVRDSADDMDTEHKNISALISYNVDGLLWEPAGDDSLKLAEELNAQDIPYLLFNSGCPGAINLDYRKMGYFAASVLIEHGHRDIACLLAEGSRTEAFAEGYKQCLFDHQLPLNEELIFTGITGSLRHKIAAHTISGIIVSHFRMAVELYEEVHSLYYELPYDLSLISLRDAGRSEMNYPKISSIDIPFYDYGAHMAAQLIALLERDEAAGASEPSFPIRLDDLETVGVPFNDHSKRVMVVGSINIDNYLNVDALPYSGKTVKSVMASSYPGGKGLNTAAGISKLGHQVSLIGKVGNDAESDVIFSSLNSHHVDPSGVRRCRDAKTGQAHIFVQPDGASMITIMSGANNLLAPSDVEAAHKLFENASFCIMQTEVPIDTLIRAAELARSMGLKTVLKPSTSGRLPAELIKNIDIIVPNESELNDILPESGGGLEEKAKELLSLGAGTVIVTLGDRGCYVRDKNHGQYYPAQEFDPIDSSGACDAFISSLVSYLLYGYGMDEAIRISHYAAGFSVTRQGVVPSLIDRSSLESYIRRKEPELLGSEPGSGH